MKLTELEFSVFLRIARSENPWTVTRGAQASRAVTQAIERLKRKGAIVTSFEPGREGTLTEAGRAYLELAGKISEPKA